MSHSCAHGGGENDKRQAQEQSMKETLAKVKHKLLIMSGKGGVGKSTVAVNLAVALSKQGNKVGLLDVDLHGPSIPGMLGLADARPEAFNGKVKPLPFNENLKVISMGNFLPQKDDAVIWRGPLKIGAIRQFIAEAEWGELDYLIIDSPPGTGDEPLTVAQDITGSKAVVVTTPQEVSLTDVRKSLNFCRNVGMPIVGIVENMSGFVCPSCGNVEYLFGKGGGEKTAKNAGVSFLGGIPIVPGMVTSGDTGTPYLTTKEADSKVVEAYDGIVKNIEAYLANEETEAPVQETEEACCPTREAPDGCTKVAIPMADGLLCAHFGHCEKFVVFTVKGKDIIDKTELSPPAHEPGVLPRWLAEHGVKLVLAGGMGERAIDFFNQYGVQVITGSPSLAPETVLTQHLEGTLETGDNVCDH